MKNITFSADESLITEARRRARAENVTLNEVFREWLQRYIQEPLAGEQYEALMADLAFVNAGQTFSRDEMNERR